jgi:hypothetical protein
MSIRLLAWWTSLLVLFSLATITIVTNVVSAHKPLSVSFERFI